MGFGFFFIEFDFKSAGGSYQYQGYTNGSTYPREQYQGGSQYPGGYPGYPSGYDSQGSMVQQSGYPPSYQGYKQSGGYTDYSGAYYYNCPSGPSETASSSNTPLPPDFSYVGANHASNAVPPDPSSYSDFYAMG